MLRIVLKSASHRTFGDLAPALYGGVDGVYLDFSEIHGPSMPPMVSRASQQILAHYGTLLSSQNLSNSIPSGPHKRVVFQPDVGAWQQTGDDLGQSIFVGGNLAWVHTISVEASVNKAVACRGRGLGGEDCAAYYDGPRQSPVDPSQRQDLIALVGGDVASHELGHLLGLRHDGRQTPELMADQISWPSWAGYLRLTPNDLKIAALQLGR